MADVFGHFINFINIYFRKGATGNTILSSVKNV